MFSSSVATPLKSYKHFSDIGVKIFLIHRHIKKKFFYDLDLSTAKLRALAKVMPIFAARYS